MTKGRIAAVLCSALLSTCGGTNVFHLNPEGLEIEAGALLVLDANGEIASISDIAISGDEVIRGPKNTVLDSENSTVLLIWLDEEQILRSAPGYRSDDSDLVKYSATEAGPTSRFADPQRFFLPTDAHVAQLILEESSKASLTQTSTRSYAALAGVTVEVPIDSGWCERDRVEHFELRGNFNFNLGGSGFGRVEQIHRLKDGRYLGEVDKKLVLSKLDGAIPRTSTTPPLDIFDPIDFGVTGIRGTVIEPELRADGSYTVWIGGDEETPRNEAYVYELRVADDGIWPIRKVPISTNRDFPPELFALVRDEQGWLIGGGADGFVIVSKDGGQTFEELAVAPLVQTPRDVHTIAFTGRPEEPVLLGLNGNEVLTGDLHANTWGPRISLGRELFGEDNDISAAVSTPDGTIFAIARSLLAKSSLPDRQWVTLPLELPPSFTGCTTAPTFADSSLRSRELALVDRNHLYFNTSGCTAVFRYDIERNCVAPVLRSNDVPSRLDANWTVVVLDDGVYLGGLGGEVWTLAASAP